MLHTQVVWGLYDVSILPMEVVFSDIRWTYEDDRKDNLLTSCDKQSAAEC